jgi:poly [ADP-ribose] polymerase
MFGKGIYLADMSSKSAQYCQSFLSGNTGILLLCDAELGKDKYECIQGDYNAACHSKEKNMISTIGSGQYGPKAWKSADCVGLKDVTMVRKIPVTPDVYRILNHHTNFVTAAKPNFTTPASKTDVPCAMLQYNEYICYDVKQVCIRFLFRIKMHVSM